MKLYFIAYSISVWTCPPFLGRAPEAIKTLLCDRKHVIKVSPPTPTLPGTFRAINMPFLAVQKRINEEWVDAFQVIELQGLRKRDIKVVFQPKEE